MKSHAKLQWGSKNFQTISLIQENNVIFEYTQFKNNKPGSSPKKKIEPGSH